MVVRSSALLAQRAGNAQIRMELEMLNVYRYVCRFSTLCSRVEVIFVKLFIFNFRVNKPMTSLVIVKMVKIIIIIIITIIIIIIIITRVLLIIIIIITRV